MFLLGCALRLSLANAKPKRGLESEESWIKEKIRAVYKIVAARLDWTICIESYPRHGDAIIYLALSYGG